MTSVPGPAFRAHLATLDRETATAFVAAVYAARGWAVDRDGDGLRATPPGTDRPRRLVVRVGGGESEGWRGSGREGDGTDPVHVDAATLQELVAYALPAAERTRLCREFLGREFEAVDASPAVGRADVESDDAAREATNAGATRREGEGGKGSGPATASTDDGGRAADADTEHGAGSDANGDGRTGTTRRERLVRAGVVVIAFSLVLGGVVAAAGPGLAGSAAVFDGNGTADDAGTGAAEDGPVTDAPSPAGLDGDGIGNARRLADAHEAALDGRSFRLRIVHREFVDGDLRGVAHERAVVAATGRYRSEVRRLGTVDHGATVIGEAATYSDGERRYVRSAGGDGDAAGESPTLRLRTTMATTEPNRFVDRTERYVRWYLGVRESRRVGTVERNRTTLYVIDFEGDPWPGATDVSGRALVDETGVVREIRRTHVPRGNRSVRIETVVRITPDRVRVTRPSWVPTDEPRHGVVNYSETGDRNDTDAEIPRPPRDPSAVDASPPAPPRASPPAVVRRDR
jgi:hypothetical protein